jgi:hypothetical protein
VLLFARLGVACSGVAVETWRVELRPGRARRGSAKSG